MFSFTKLVAAVLVLGAGLFVTGCASTSKANTTASLAPSTQAVTCDGCKITWVQVPIQGGKGHIIGYSTQKKMECPACKDAVSNFFATGHLEHACSVCGGNMTICDLH